MSFKRKLRSPGDSGVIYSNLFKSVSPGQKGHQRTGYPQHKPGVGSFTVQCAVRTPASPRPWILTGCGCRTPEKLTCLGVSSFTDVKPKVWEEAVIFPMNGTKLLNLDAGLLPKPVSSTQSDRDSFLAVAEGVSWKKASRDPRL